jgi:hypothetical protein
MAGENNVESLNGLFKTVYADKLIDLIPDYAVLQKRIDFVSAEKETGAFYAQPVVLSHESGFTYNGTAGGVAALNAQKAGAMKEAQIYGSELILRSQLSYTALSRAASSGARAFKRASSFKVEDMNNAARKRLEIAMLYGQSGIGVVESISDTGTSVGTITITAGSWAGGIWAGAEGASIDSFTTTTKNNGAADIVIKAVDSDTRTLTVTCDDTMSSEVAAGDILFFKGANAGSGSFNEMAGLSAIIQNSSTLFGINAATYSLWKGTTISSVGQISFAKLQDAVGRAANKGLMEKVLVLVSPKAWSVLNSDQAALRMFDSSYSSKKAENGAGSLMFHGLCGPMEVVSHPLVKDGDAFIVPPDSLMRVGSVDLSFGVPGFDEQFFQLVPSYNAVELQCMADQAIFVERPAHCVFLTGIAYT